jgi:hypothetical protein
MNKPAFKHLLAHFRGTKNVVNQTLLLNSACSLAWQKRANELALARSVGALDCLYWQALGNGLTNLAKGIRRYSHKLKAHAQVDGL